MARQIDLPPINDVLTKSGAEISDIWRDYMARFVDTLVDYLSENGMFVPRLTQDQINGVSPVNGQIVYNTTTQTYQGYSVNAWKTFTLV